MCDNQQTIFSLHPYNSSQFDYYSLFFVQHVFSTPCSALCINFFDLCRLCFVDNSSVCEDIFPAPEITPSRIESGLRSMELNSRSSEVNFMKNYTLLFLYLFYSSFQILSSGNLREGNISRGFILRVPTRYNQARNGFLLLLSMIRMTSVKERSVCSHS